tara:strand:- start:3034 stop:3915 length:882 start_codon:yes stop_codon:yes gene_type:complete
MSPKNKYPIADSSAPENGVFLIAPEAAYVWLDTRNNDNWRGLKPAQVAKYLRQIRNGQWVVTHEAIGFDWNGQLFDGQHRLAAIVEYGKPVPMRVVVGVDPKAREVVDSGMARTVGDTLAASGYTNTPTMATVARFWHRRTNGHTSRVALAPVEVAAIVKDMPGLEAICAEAMGTYSTMKGVKLFGPGPVAIAAYCISVERTHRMVREFFKFMKTVASGVGFEPGSAELALSHRLQREREAAKATGRTSVGQDLLVALILSGFRASRRKGSSISRLVLSGNETPSDLPYLDRS